MAAKFKMAVQILITSNESPIIPLYRKVLLVVLYITNFRDIAQIIHQKLLKFLLFWKLFPPLVTKGSTNSIKQKWHYHFFSISNNYVHLYQIWKTLCTQWPSFSENCSHPITLCYSDLELLKWPSVGCRSCWV